MLDASGYQRGTEYTNDAPASCQEPKEIRGSAELLNDYKDGDKGDNQITKEADELFVTSLDPWCPSSLRCCEFDWGRPALA